MYKSETYCSNLQCVSFSCINISQDCVGNVFFTDRKASFTAPDPWTQIKIGYAVEIQFDSVQFNEQALSDRGNGKHSFNRKKPQVKPHSGRGSHLHCLVGGKGKKTGQKTVCVREPEINNQFNQ